jgi:hypothetical protein
MKRYVFSFSEAKIFQSFFSFIFLQALQEMMSGE